MTNELLNAMKNGDVEYIRKYIEDGGDVDAECDRHTPLIHYAVDGHTKNSTTIAKMLIDAGCDINRPLYRYGDIDDYYFPIHFCTYKCLKLLIEEGCDINITDSKGRTPLNALAERIWYSGTGDTYEVVLGDGTYHRYGYMKKMKLLIESGCKLDIKDKDYEQWDYKDYLYHSKYYKCFKDEIEEDLSESFRIRYSRQSLLELCRYHIKTNEKKYQEFIPLLIPDLRKLIKRSDIESIKKQMENKKLIYHKDHNL